MIMAQSGLHTGVSRRRTGPNPGPGIDSGVPDANFAPRSAQLWALTHDGPLSGPEWGSTAVPAPPSLAPNVHRFPRGRKIPARTRAVSTRRAPDGITPAHLLQPLRQHRVARFSESGVLVQDLPGELSRLFHEDRVIERIEQPER